MDENRETSPDRVFKKRSACTEREFSTALFDAFLGLESDLVQYIPETGSFTLTITNSSLLNAPRKEVINHILSLSADYRQTTEALTLDYYVSNQNPIIRALAESADEELRKYVKQIIHSQDEASSNSQVPITLIHLYGYYLEHHMFLQLLSKIVRDCLHKKWNDILSCLYSHMQSGNLQMDAALRRIALRVFTVFFKAVYSWISEGNIVHEDAFFIKDNHEAGCYEVWTSKFSIEIDSLPSFIDIETAEKILYLGKARRFLSMIAPDYNYKELIKPTPIESEDDCTTALENLQSVINKTRLAVDKTLNGAIDGVCNILEVSDFLKSIILLSGSHFPYTLLSDLKPRFLNIPLRLHKKGILFPIEPVAMDTMPSNMNPAYTKKLSISIDHGNYKYNALMDLVIITYTPDFPENIFLTKSVLKKYTEYFSFIWSIFRLRDTMVGCAKLRLWLMKFLKKNFHGNMQMFLHTSAILHRMCCFLTALLEHINIHCLQSAWSEFKRNIDTSEDFDHKLKAHNNYVNSIEAGVMFRNGQDGGSLLSEIHDIFRLIQSAISSSCIMQLIQIRLLRDDNSNVNSRLDIIKHENLILEEVESGEIICGLKLQFSVDSNSELLNAYSKLKSISSSYVDKTEKLKTALAKRPEHDMKVLIANLNYT